MIIEKNKIRSIIRSHKISSLQAKNEEDIINFFYELLAELETAQQEKLATKEDIKNLMQLMEKRFEAIDKRFEEMSQNNNKRFEAIDKRFEDLYHYMDKRFEAFDKRFEDMNKRFNMMFTFMSIGFTIIIVLTVLFKFIQ